MGLPGGLLVLVVPPPSGFPLLTPVRDRRVLLELKLELTQARMIEKPLLRVEVG
jgi:hypothetical protein